MRICICDDILEYRTAIKCFVENYCIKNRIECKIDEFASSKELLAANVIEEYNIYFIDIELGDSNGIELIKVLMKNNYNSVFIVVTAYNQYLDDAMDLQVLRYIDKPIKQERINSALDRAIDKINNSMVTIRAKGGEQLFIKKQDIIYAEAKFKITYIFTTKGTIESPLPLKYYKKVLNAPDFIIPHNSFIVNINYIVSFKRSRILISNNNDDFIWIPISAPKQHEMNTLFKIKK